MVDRDGGTSKRKMLLGTVAERRWIGRLCVFQGVLQGEVGKEKKKEEGEEKSH